MTASRPIVLLTLVAAVLAATSLWLAFDNPEIDSTSKGEGYPCLAPWDTVLNDADNVPGGEPPPDAEQIGSRCREAGSNRFDLAVATGSVAAVMAVIAVAASVRRRSTTADSPH